MEVVYKKKDVIGLDLGTSSVKFAQLKNAGKLTKLVGYGRVDIPDNIIVEGVISEPEKLAELLKKNFQTPPWGKITAKRVIASLPEARIFTRIIELPSLAGKDVTEAINYEVEQTIPIPQSDLYIDFEVIDENSEKMTVFLSAAPRAIVDSYVQLFKELAMDPLALEPSLLSIARSMVSNKAKIEPVIIFDIGGTTTNLAVFDTTLKITESLPVGGATIKESLMQILAVPEKEATILVREGFKKETKAGVVIKEEIEKIMLEIKKMIDYYEEKNPGKITKILVSGGLAHTPGLSEYLKDELNLDVKIGNPWVNISIYPLKPVPKEQAPGYAAAIGLCLRGIND